MRKLLLVAALSVAFNVVNAQNTTTQPKTNQHAPAEELLSVMGLDKMTDEVMKEMLDVQIQSNPMLASKRETLESFFKKYMSWSVLKDDYVKIYESEFTENEIKDITAFYRTPTGKKLAEKSAVLAIKGSKLGQQKVQEHMGELQEMLMKE